MAVIKKTLFAKNLDKYAVLVNDTQSDSKYFKITELPDTFTGGKNAFLIAGSEYLVPDTKIQIELKDSAGNIIYHEPGEGMISSSINGETFVTEYYEGVSKVVAIYVYPDTSYGPCTLTILGELSEYEDANGLTLPVPLDWENKYNVKWQKQIDVNPSLANTTKIRFYKRPTVSITELLEPIYRIESGSKVSSGINQSFAEIKLSQLETFAGDVKRVKVFRTSLGDISDFSLIQDILVESKELLTTFGLSGSVIGNTGTFTSETLKNFWNTGSLNAQLSNNRIENGIKINGGGNFTYTSSLDLKSANTYELNLDAFYSSSTSSNLGIYLSQLTSSIQEISPGVSGSVSFYVSTSFATLVGTQPTKNLLDTVIPFKIDRDYPSASLYFSQSQGEWHLGNISLRLSQDTAFSPDEISFITPMPTVIGNEDFNFKFEFFDVNNNYVPVFVTQSANFTGGSNTITKLLTFESDRTAFRFSSGSFANPPNQSVRFKTIKTNFTGSITYASSAFDVGGNYIQPSTYAGAYPGWFTSQNDNGALLNIASFSGSVASVLVGSIVYTASCEGFQEFETIYRFEDGDNAPGVFVTANTNQFIYKATDLSLNPTGQVITIEAKRKNLASASTPLTINSGSGKPPLTFVSTNTTNGVDTYTISGTSYPYSTNETIYSISGSDQFGNIFSDAIKISPVKILDGFSIATSNENASFPANSVGSVIGGFAASSGSITVKVGNETINYSSLFVTNSFSASISAFSNLTPNAFNGTNYSINALSADSGSLTLLVKYKDGGGTIISSSKDITYSKVKKAAPVLAFVIGNNNQTVTARSTGLQIDSFVTASLSVIETYDGISSTKTLIAAPTTTATNSYTIGNKTTTTIALPNMANGTDSVDIFVTGSVVDSENITRNVFGNISLAKTKKAVPNVVISATPQAQSILATAAGVQTGNLTNVTISALEGTTSRFTSMTATYTGFSTEPFIATNSNILTTSAAIMNAAEASATIVVTHSDSEGTTGQTQTIVVRFTKVPTGTAGTPGLNGADGGTGPGVVYRGDWSGSTTYFSSSIRVDVVRGSDSEYYLAKVGHTSTANGALDKPITGTSYTTYWRPFGATFESIATDILLARDATITRGLVMGTYGATDKGFIRSANATALMSGKGYYLDTTGSMRFGDPGGGYIRFTESDGVRIAGNVAIEGTVTIGATSATTVESKANSAQQNTSAKTAGSVGGWSIDSDAIYSGTKDADGYTAGGITLNSGGSIHSPNFYIDTAGSAFFRGNGTFTGTLTSTAGNIGGWSIGSTFISASRTLLKNDGVIELRNSEQSVKVTIDGGTTLPDPQTGASNITLSLPQQGPGTATITSFTQYISTTNTVTITKTGSYRFRATILSNSQNGIVSNPDVQWMQARLYINGVERQAITGNFLTAVGNYPDFGLNFADFNLNSGDTVYIILRNDFYVSAGSSDIKYYVPATTITGISNVPKVGINQEGFQIIQDSSRFFTIKPSTLDFYNNSVGAQDRKIIGTQSGPLVLNNAVMAEWHNGWQNVYHNESTTPLTHEAAGGHNITSYYWGGKNRAFQIIRAYGIIGTGAGTNWYPAYDYTNRPDYFWYNVDTVTRNASFQYTVTFVEPIYSYDTVREGTEYYSVFIGGRGETPGFGLPWVTNISNTGFTVFFYQLENKEDAQFSFMVVK
jgi:hypothetical protein